MLFIVLFRLYYMAGSNLLQSLQYWINANGVNDARSTHINADIRINISQIKNAFLRTGVLYTFS